MQKIRSYVGYAVKAGRVCFGVETITKSRAVSVCLYDATLSENSKNKLLSVMEERGVPTYRVDVEEIYPNKNCKAIGVKDKNLSTAIIKEMEESGKNE